METQRRCSGADKLIQSFLVSRLAPPAGGVVRGERENPRMGGYVNPPFGSFLGCGLDQMVPTVSPKSWGGRRPTGDAGFGRNASVVGCAAESQVRPGPTCRPNLPPSRLNEWLRATYACGIPPSAGRGSEDPLSAGTDQEGGTGTVGGDGSRGGRTVAGDRGPCSRGHRSSPLLRCPSAGCPSGKEPKRPEGSNRFDATPQRLGSGDRVALAAAHADEGVGRQCRAHGTGEQLCLACRSAARGHDCFAAKGETGRAHLPGSLPVRTERAS
jgi:hypothetical protein